MIFNDAEVVVIDDIRKIPKIDNKNYSLPTNVIRCKDCKYKVVTEDGEWNPEDIVCDYWASDGLEADDFCSRGERKDE